MIDGSRRLSIASRLGTRKNANTARNTIHVEGEVDASVNVVAIDNRLPDGARYPLRRVKRTADWEDAR